MKDCVIAFPEMMLTLFAFACDRLPTSEDERERDAGTCYALDDKVVRHSCDVLYVRASEDVIKRNTKV